MKKVKKSFQITRQKRTKVRQYRRRQKEDDAKGDTDSNSFTNINSKTYSQNQLIILP